MPDYTFRLATTSYKSRDLIYDEPGHRLVVYLEMSGVPEFDWVGAETDLDRWTDPAGEPIPADKRAQITQRLADWAGEQRLRIDLGPAMNFEEHLAEEAQRGCRVERRPDGTIAVYPPERQSMWTRVVARARAYLQR